MSFVDIEGLAVEAIAVELDASFVGIACGHLHKSEAIANDIHGNYRADNAKQIFHSRALRAVRQVSNQELLCQSYRLHTYAQIRIFMHRQVCVKQYFEVAEEQGLWHYIVTTEEE